MSTLRLRIDKPTWQDVPEAPEVFARIFRIDESGARIISTQGERTEMIPISEDSRDVKSIEVPPGHYFAETVLPSGEILADDIEVVEGQSHELVLRGDDTEPSSVSHFPAETAPDTVESIQPSGQAEGRKRYRTKRPRGRRLFDVGGLDVGGLGKAAGYLSKSYMTIAAPLLWLSDSHPALAQSDSTQTWAVLGDLVPASYAEVLATLNTGQALRAVTASELQGGHTIAGYAFSFVLIPPKSSGASRSVLLVNRPSGLELINLPIPWQGWNTMNETGFEIQITGEAKADEFCTSVTVKDMKLSMLVAYLASGSLPATRQMSEQLKLYDAIPNPFAAAAGGYALVGTARDSSKPEWQSWVKRLMDEFPHVPDGAIQWGQLKLQLGRDASDLAEAARAFKVAYRRGLPFYSLGMRWLLDGLEWIAPEDNEASFMLQHVRRLARRVNYQQAFTILRLGTGSNV